MTTDEMLFGLVSNAVENYAAKRTEAGATISEGEAKCFAANIALLIRVLLNTDVKFPGDTVD